MAALIIVLLVLLALGVLGTVVKGLLWLTLIAVLLAAAGVAFGFFKFRRWRGRSAA